MKILTYDDLAQLSLLALDLLPGWFRRLGLQRLLGELDYVLRAGRRKTILASMSLAFGGEKTPSEIESTVRQSYRNKWSSSGVLQLGRLASSATARQEALASVTVDGVEHLHGALANGKGAILWDSPFGSQLLIKLTLLRDGHDFTAIQGPGHGGSQSWVGQKFFRPRYHSAEKKLTPNIVKIADDDFRYLGLLIERLEQNRLIFGNSFGPMGKRFFALDFLGRKQCFATGIVSLAASTEAPLIPVFGFQDEQGRKRVTFEPPVDLSPGRTRDELYLRVLREQRDRLESRIRRAPMQWSRWYDPLTPSRVMAETPSAHIVEP